MYQTRSPSLRTSRTDSSKSSKSSRKRSNSKEVSTLNADFKEDFRLFIEWIFVGTGNQALRGGNGGSACNLSRMMGELNPEYKIFIPCFDCHVLHRHRHRHRPHHLARRRSRWQTTITMKLVIWPLTFSSLSSLLFSFL